MTGARSRANEAFGISVRCPRGPGLKLHFSSRSAASGEPNLRRCSKASPKTRHNQARLPQNRECDVRLARRRYRFTPSTATTLYFAKFSPTFLMFSYSGE